MLSIHPQYTNGYSNRIVVLKLQETMKNAVFWDIMPRGFCKNRRFGATSVLIKATRRNIPEDGILRSHRRQNLKS
jgi:hypothetical protein